MSHTPAEGRGLEVPVIADDWPSGFGLKGGGFGSGRRVKGAVVVDDSPEGRLTKLGFCFVLTCHRLLGVVDALFQHRGRNVSFKGLTNVSHPVTVGWGVMSKHPRVCPENFRKE